MKVTVLNKSEKKVFNSFEELKENIDDIAYDVWLLNNKDLPKVCTQLKDGWLIACFNDFRLGNGLFRREYTVKHENSYFTTDADGIRSLIPKKVEFNYDDIIKDRIIHYKKDKKDLHISEWYKDLEKKEIEWHDRLRKYEKAILLFESQVKSLKSQLAKAKDFNEIAEKKHKTDFDKISKELAKWKQKSKAKKPAKRKRP